MITRDQFKSLGTESLKFLGYFETTETENYKDTIHYVSAKYAIDGKELRINVRFFEEKAWVSMNFDGKNDDEILANNFRTWNEINKLLQNTIKFVKETNFVRLQFLQNLYKIECTAHYFQKYQGDDEFHFKKIKKSLIDEFNYVANNMDDVFTNLTFGVSLAFIDDLKEQPPLVIYGKIGKLIGEYFESENIGTYLGEENYMHKILLNFTEEDMAYTTVASWHYASFLSINCELACVSE
jgi:hypothetical protein